jgi:hypothetical protein
MMRREREYHTTTAMITMWCLAKHGVAVFGSSAIQRSGILGIV